MKAIISTWPVSASWAMAGTRPPALSKSGVRVMMCLASGDPFPFLLMLTGRCLLVFRVRWMDCTAKPQAAIPRGGFASSRRQSQLDPLLVRDQAEHLHRRQLLAPAQERQLDQERGGDDVP